MVALTVQVLKDAMSKAGGHVVQTWRLSVGVCLQFLQKRVVNAIFQLRNRLQVDVDVSILCIADFNSNRIYIRLWR